VELASYREFDIDEVIRRLRIAVLPYPKAMLFELYDRGYKSPFEQLVACLISIRTRDEVSLVAALSLFDKARTPSQVAHLSVNHLDRLIHASTFHLQKAERIHAIATTVMNEFKGRLPCEYETLVELPGVGPKCAALALGIACGQPAIGVDIHVHRVTNRWGFVYGKTPEATRDQLSRRLPKKYWVEINSLLVPFGKHICTGTRPKCSTCPVAQFCPRIGVVNPR
jgi:endonuclease-3